MTPALQPCREHLTGSHEAVAAAYGWPADLSDDEILKGLFELNQERAGVARTAIAPAAVA